MKMVKLKINDIEIEVEAESTILEAAKSAGFAIPTLCHWPYLNEIGACRVCAVEVKGCDRLVTACNTKVADGMEIVSNSERVRETRAMNVELILAEHDCHCLSCVRNGNCALQALARDMSIDTKRFESVPKHDSCVPGGLPFIRDAAKCVKCMRCVSVCDKIQGLKVWDLLNSGKRARVGVSGGKRLDNVSCSFCGQCVAHCPTAALVEVDDTEKLLAAIQDQTKTVVVQVAPAVRAALGEALGLKSELATEKRLVAAISKLGVDYVFDTNFAADLTIMEEGNELLERMKSPNFKKPMFTSCCPGWVRFLKQGYPELLPQLSTAKSPQQMFGSIVKSYFAEKIDKSRSEIFSVSIMPCIAKKYERTIDDTVDVVLTTRELARLIKRFGIDVASLPEREFDSPLGTSTGAAVIFGRTGGVMESALRVIDAKNVRTKVVSGLGAARRLIEDLRAGRVEYDFVEVMACPGGCVGGGGQAYADGKEPAFERAEMLNRLDESNPLQKSSDNPEVQTLYREYLGQPLSSKAHELLHTEQRNWKL